MSIREAIQRWVQSRHVAAYDEARAAMVQLDRDFDAGQVRPIEYLLEYASLINARNHHASLAGLSVPQTGNTYSW